MIERPDRPDPQDAFPGDLGYMILPGRTLVGARFGIPASGNPADSRRPRYLHNARSETVAELRTFRRHFREHRCIVPAPAFFEQHQGRWLRMRPVEGPAFAIAGIYAPGEPAGFAMVTTEPNPRIADVHDRMPVVLAIPEMDVWLNPATPLDELEALLTPCPDEWLVIEDAGSNRRVARPPQDGLF